MFYIYLVLQLALFLLALGGFFQVKQFLSQHDRITSGRHLDNFKSLVRVNMYIALAYLALAAPGILLSIYFGFTYGVSGSAFVIALNVPHFLFAKYLKVLEVMASRLECSREYADEFRAVSETWFKKALPNF